MEHQPIVELCHHPRSAIAASVRFGWLFRVKSARKGEMRQHHALTGSGSAPHLMLLMEGN